MALVKKNQLLITTPNKEEQKTEELSFILNKKTKV
jgi:hypothetical protein